jgi:isomaltose glucohydrolase
VIAQQQLLSDLLFRRSIEVLRRGQSASGALIASPTFPVYRYAWLRDGAFCAHALDLVGEREAAARYHAWVSRSLEAHRQLIEAAIGQIDGGRTPPAEAMPPARYTLEGTLEPPDDDPWPNFQIDGYGTWLWALDQHLLGSRPSDAQLDTVRLVARYLTATWRLKCFNCWEEFDGGEHASTLAAVYAGLAAAARLLNDAGHATEAERVRGHLLDRFVIDGRFRRGALDDRLDGCLLWLDVPFRVLPSSDSRIVATVDAVRRDLVGPGGGLYRYLGDSYYGGGQWLLLTSSLAWRHAATGNDHDFITAQHWVRGQATPNGALPEQVSDHAQQPAMTAPWLERWGPVATPLLWSHAMYLIAEVAAYG